jgi:hypothetical protein
MVSERKPSIYSDRGGIGSADELDKYGVWVKSGPQDLSSAGIAGDDFDDLSLPDFETNSGEETPVSDLSFPDGGEFEQAFFEPIKDIQIPEIDLADVEAAFEKPGDDLAPPDDDMFTGSSGFSTEHSVAGESEYSQTGISGNAPKAERQGGTDLSTQLLIQIAGELSSIRNELASLKKEFAGVRIEVQTEDKTDALRGGFFTEEDDEKIALTGDELDTIMHTAELVEEIAAPPDLDAGPEDIVSSQDDFAAVEEDIGFISDDAGFVSPEIVSEDIPEAAVFSEMDDSAAGDAEAAGPDTPGEAEAEEEIEIDFDDLGINLNIDPADFDLAPEAGAGDETAPDASLTDMAQDFTADDFGDMAEENLLIEDHLLDDTLTPGADLFEEITPGESVLTEENLLTEETAAEAGGEPEAAEISLVNELEDFDALGQFRSEGVEPMTAAPENSSYLEEDPLAGVILEDGADAGISPDEEPDLDAASFDLSEIDGTDLSAEIAENRGEEPAPDEFSLDGFEDINIELEDEQFETMAGESEAVEPELPVSGGTDESETLEISLSAEDDSLAQVIPEGFETESPEAPVPFDDDLESAFAEDGLENIGAPPETGGDAAFDTGEGAAIAEDEPAAGAETLDIPAGLKKELKTVLSYMDHLLESLPEDKIEEFAKSEYFDTYKKLFKELGLV